MLGKKKPATLAAVGDLAINMEKNWVVGKSTSSESESRVIKVEMKEDPSSGTSDPDSLSEKVYEMTKQFGHITSLLQNLSNGVIHIMPNRQSSSN